MIFSTVKRLASDILGVGRNKIRIDPDSVNEIRGAQTRADIKQFIEKGLIKKVSAPGRGSARKKARHGEGHRRGIVIPEKESWMEKVRSQRKLLVMLLESGVIKRDQKWSLYRKVKSGLFRNKKAMIAYLQDAGLVAKDYVMPKAEYKKPEKQKQNPKKVVEKKVKVKKARVDAPKTEVSKLRGEQPKTQEQKEEEKKIASRTTAQASHYPESERKVHDKKGDM